MHSSAEADREYRIVSARAVGVHSIFYLNGSNFLEAVKKRYASLKLDTELVNASIYRTKSNDYKDKELIGVISKGKVTYENVYDRITAGVNLLKGLTVPEKETKSTLPAVLNTAPKTEPTGYLPTKHKIGMKIIYESN